MVLRAYLRAETPVYQQQGGVRHVERGERSTHEVVRARTVYYIEFLAHPLHVEDGGKDGVAVVLLHGEIVADGILGRDAPAPAYLPAFKEQGLGERSLARAVIAEKGNVLDFVGLVYFHSVRRFIG